MSRVIAVLALAGRMFGILALAGMATAASAQLVNSVSSGTSGPLNNSPGPILCDTSNTSGNGIIDQAFPDLFPYSTYMVDDFSTGGLFFHVHKVTTYFTRGFGDWDNSITQATLELYPKTGALPNDSTDNPPGQTVACTLTNLGTAWAVSADTTGVLPLLHGDYWIGLTPVAPFTRYGQEFHLMSAIAVSGSGAAVRNPGGGFGFGTDWIDAGAILDQVPQDMCFTLECVNFDSPVCCWCPADLNRDGHVNDEDFVQFVQAFETGDMAADFNQDDFLTGEDFDQYVREFEGGC